MILPLLVLVVGSLFLGYFGKDLFLGLGSDFFMNSIYVHPKNLLFVDAEFVPYHIKLIPVIFSFGGIGLSFFVYLIFFKVTELWLNFYKLNIKYLKVFRFIYKFFNKK